MPTDLIHRVGFLNPNGIPSFSPGLERPPSLRFGAARSDYPGSSSRKIINPTGLYRRFHFTTIWFNPFRVDFNLTVHPG